MTPPNHQRQIATLAHNVADEAGKILQRWFRRGDSTPELKPDETFVCKADLESEDAIRSLIAKQFPTDGILGEERDPTNPKAEWVWVLDPLDGTNAFLDGIPLFGVLVALYRRGENGTSEAVYGLVDMPILKERWWGDGSEAFYNGTKCRTKAPATLAEASVYASSPHMFRAGYQPQFQRLASKCRRAAYGLHCYAYGLLASGTIPLVAEADMKLFDFAPMPAILKAAGGVITNWEGEPAGLTSGETILAAGDANLHSQALRCLK